MGSIYLDNASTTFPKPRAVADAMYGFLTQTGSNINRGCYQRAYRVEETVYETRQMLCELFGGEDCKNVVFTKNVTESLNVLLKGFLQPGDHVLWSTTPSCGLWCSWSAEASPFPGSPAQRTGVCGSSPSPAA